MNIFALVYLVHSQTKKICNSKHCSSVPVFSVRVCVCEVVYKTLAPQRKNGGEHTWEDAGGTWPCRWPVAVVCQAVTGLAFATVQKMLVICLGFWIYFDIWIYYKKLISKKNRSQNVVCRVREVYVGIVYCKEYVLITDLIFIFQKFCQFRLDFESI